MTTLLKEVAGKRWFDIESDKRRILLKYVFSPDHIVDTSVQRITKEAEKEYSVLYVELLRSFKKAGLPETDAENLSKEWAQVYAKRVAVHLESVVL